MGLDLVTVIAVPIPVVVVLIAPVPAVVIALVPVVIALVPVVIAAVVTILVVAVITVVAVMAILVAPIAVIAVAIVTIAIEPGTIVAVPVPAVAVIAVPVIAVIVAIVTAAIVIAAVVLRLILAILLVLAAGQGRAGGSQQSRRIVMVQQAVQGDRAAANREVPGIIFVALVIRHCGGEGRSGEGGDQSKRGHLGSQCHGNSLSCFFGSFRLAVFLDWAWSQFVPGKRDLVAKTVLDSFCGL